MIAFALAVASVVGLSATPACRLQEELAAQVRQAATAALRAWPDDERGAAPRFRGVMVNPMSDTAGSLAVEIVSDADADAVDLHGCIRPDTLSATGLNRPDPWTVLGVCTADAVQGNRIRCSADALRALTRKDQAAKRPSPALLYLLAHEIAHLYQGKPAAFAGPALTLDLGAARSTRLRQMRPLCQAEESGQLTLEAKADQKALAVLEAVLPSNAYRKPLLSPHSSLYALVAEIRDAAAELTRWESGEKAPLTPPVALRLQTLEPDSENIARTATRLLCEVFGDEGGRVLLPNTPGSHPTAAARLSEISSRLRKKAAELPFGPFAKPLPGTEDVVNQMDEKLIPTLGLVSASLDLSEKEFYQRLWPYLCETYLNPASRRIARPRCRTATSLLVRSSWECSTRCRPHPRSPGRRIFPRKAMRSPFRAGSARPFPCPARDFWRAWLNRPPSWSGTARGTLGLWNCLVLPGRSPPWERRRGSSAITRSDLWLFPAARSDPSTGSRAASSTTRTCSPPRWRRSGWDLSDRKCLRPPIFRRPARA